MEKMQNTLIDSHRNMLMFSKNLSSFQLDNLKNWPFIFFDGVTSSSLDYNFVRGDEFYAGTVEFDITTQQTENLEAAILHLEAATKLMFWTDTKVIIKINGRKWKKTSSNTKKTSRQKSHQPSKDL